MVVLRTTWMENEAVVVAGVHEKENEAPPLAVTRLVPVEELGKVVVKSEEIAVVAPDAPDTAIVQVIG